MATPVRCVLHAPEPRGGGRCRTSGFPERGARSGAAGTDPKETEEARNLILALAFSDTGVVSQHDGVKFAVPAAFRGLSGSGVLPFHFERFAATGAADEHGRRAPVRLARASSTSLMAKNSSRRRRARRLRAKHIIREAGRRTSARAPSAEGADALYRLPEFTGLHIFVVSLRCEHSCPYCQVSRQSTDKAALRHVARRRRERALEVMFQSPSPQHQDRVSGRRAAAQLPLIGRSSRKRRR